MPIKSTDVILHAFDWPYELVTQRAEQIAAIGYKSVLVSPPMKSFKHEDGTQWWQRYQPQDYRVIDNQLGDTLSFIKMVQTLDQYGLLTYVDVVFNHMANESSQRLDLQYPSSVEMAQYAAQSEHYQSLCLFGDLSKPLFEEDDFVEAFGIKDWKDKWEVQNGRISAGDHDPGLPTLRDNPHVVEQQQSFLKALKAIGVKGFRIDAAKHMTLEHLKKVWTDEITKDCHIFGEIITDGGATKEEYELFLEPYLKHTRLGAYDFPLFQTVYDALKPDGDLTALINPYCFGQALSEMRAITFAITHDIPNNDVFVDLVMDECRESLAYSYILGRDGGVPLIYTDLNTSDIRDEDGNPRWLNAWNHPDMAARIQFHNAVHGTPMKLLEANSDLLVFSRGAKGYVLINKSSRAQNISLRHPKSLVDVLSKKAFEPDTSGKVEMMLPSLTSMLLLEE